MTSPEGPVLSVEKASLMKAEFEEWGTKTTIGVIAGMLYGGCKEAMRSAGIEQALLLKHSATENFRQRRWLFREIMEQKVLRVARGTVSGGAKLGTRVLYVAFEDCFDWLSSGCNIGCSFRFSTVNNS
eukprot:c24040_g1_i3 orf=354-737(+)